MREGEREEGEAEEKDDYGRRSHEQEQVQGERPTAGGS